MYYLRAEGAPAQLLLERAFHPFEPLEQPDENFPTIIIDESKSFQAIEGFGGAFTDAATTTFGKLPKEAQDAFLKECFDPVAGNGYTLCRTTIHSCDYSPEMYTYDDTPGDKELRNFSIGRDEKERVPFIRRAMEVAKGKLRLYASPWSPPAWMKTNDDMLHGGKLKPEYAQAWADYFVKYLQAYKAAGVPMWGLTVQNEVAASRRAAWASRRASSASGRKAAAVLPRVASRRVRQVRSPGERGRDASASAGGLAGRRADDLVELW